MRKGDSTSTTQQAAQEQAVRALVVAVGRDGEAGAKTMATAAASPVDLLLSLLVWTTTKFGGDMDHRCSPKVAKKRTKLRKNSL